MLTNTVASAIVAGLAFASQVQAQKVNQSSVPTRLLSEDEEMNFTFEVPFGEAIYGGGDVNPILGVSKELYPYPGDFNKWSEVWYKLANDTKAQAQNPEFAYDPVNVRDTWFSAATYFRHADFFNHGNWSDPRINAYWAEQTYAFNQGLAAMDVPGQRVQIPTNNGFTVEAIWYTPVAESTNCTKRPTLVAGQGYDGAQEDLYVSLT